MAILQSVSKTIRKMIEDKWDSESTGLYLTSSNPSSDQSKIGFSTSVPTSKWAQKQSDATINIYLYKVTENTALRSNEWRKEVDPNTGRVIRKKPKTRINCSYIITAWFNDETSTVENYIPNVDIQHKVLSEVMAILTSYDSVPKECWDEEMNLSGQKAELPTAALLSDDVKSPGEFWSALENRLTPFLHYVVTVAVTPKENKAQKDATPVAEVDLRSKKGIDMQMSAESVGYYTIGGQIVGVPVGLVGNVLYVDQNNDEVTLDGEIQYQKDANGDRILNQVVNTSHDFDELLDALYLDVYEQVRTAQAETQYNFLAELDEYNRGRIENQIISELKREKTKKMQMLTKYRVSVDEFNRDKALCDSNGRYIFKGVPATKGQNGATFSLYKNDSLVSEKLYKVPTDGKDRFELTAAIKGQLTGIDISTVSALSFNYIAPNSAEISVTIPEIALTAENGTDPLLTTSEDLNLLLNRKYDEIYAKLRAEQPQEPFNIEPFLTSIHADAIKEATIQQYEKEKAEKLKTYKNYTLSVEAVRATTPELVTETVTEAADVDGRTLFQVEDLTAASNVVVVKNGNTTVKTETITIANYGFTIDLSA